MRVAGFVLAGGQSRRMGTNKALLPWHGATLLEHVAAQVHAAAGSVCVVGGCQEFRHLHLPCVADRHPGKGPLGGLVTALESTEADFILLAACDLPYASASVFRQLLLAARSVSGVQAIIPRHSDGRREPLSAVYHHSSLRNAQEALQSLEFKMSNLLEKLNLLDWHVSDPAPFLNINTAAEWAALGGVLA